VVADMASALPRVVGATCENLTRMLADTLGGVLRCGRTKLIPIHLVEMLRDVLEAAVIVRAMRAEDVRAVGKQGVRSELEGRSNAAMVVKAKIGDGMRMTGAVARSQGVETRVGEMRSRTKVELLTDLTLYVIVATRSVLGMRRESVSQKILQDEEREEETKRMARATNTTRERRSVTNNVCAKSLPSMVVVAKSLQKVLARNPKLEAATILQVTTATLTRMRRLPPQPKLSLPHLQKVRVLVRPRLEVPEHPAEAAR